MKFIIYILENMTGREKKTLKDTQRHSKIHLRVIEDAPRMS